MITTTVRVQLLAFLLVAVLGVGYVGVRYAGLGELAGATTYPVRMQLADSGGIFTGADVTYRGVSVGRVGPLRLTDSGVEVELRIRRGAPSIPADLDAVVRNLSAIGEQYVDLQPAGRGGPVLAAGSVIPRERTRVPVPIEDLVVSLDDVVRSVPLDSLRTVVEELGTAFTGTAGSLGSLLEDTGALTTAAIDALPETLTLIRDGRTVLTTQNDVAGEFAGFSRDLALLADRLATSDPQLRRLIAAGPPAAAEVVGLLRETGGGLGQVIADLLSTARVAQPRQDGLRQLLVTYPQVASNGFTAVPGDASAHLGLVINVFDPYPCAQGYEDTPHRPGSDVSDVPVNERAACAEPAGSPIGVRGAQNVPRAATPQPPARAAVGPAGQLPAGSAPVAARPGPVPPGSPVPLGSPAQILLG